ncbi:vacuolar protein-sorting-associated protein 25 [Cladorrhinum samala]|uniref:Vacuolar protein-sorting-associated protein 25 n=1 Tax=Cladorrhinum samala TaxID=585594 RepID=A0AAV9HSZ6_9PEZI|nr:vacuolar protein-sorting-associated protein 25 [Cladorrhinum samala]
MASKPPAPFQFPREYSFPPFFTPQTNLTTHHAQQTKWAALVLAYCRHYRIFRLSISPSPATASSQSAPPHDTSDLFHNKQLNRRLSPAHIRSVIDFLRKDGRAEYLDPKGSGDVAYVYWQTPEEWAGIIESWVEGTAQKGSVLTVYELVEGENTRGSEFWGMDRDVLIKALGVLVKRGKAQIFGQEDSLGVKFF